ncbi:MULTISPECIES: OmpA family protein [Bacteroides]|uniref:OmpA family protein n=1 Tax=Bacteroides TaxID=816 RepID=UPI000B37D10C|nr:MULTISPECIES: OmpA family protein [Bacteroides]MBM6944009.1 OmpA family protein [Bacteroides gallinaceum]OUO62858.1 hypothetical protein B5F78_02740 [Bacteroides sp. An279]
MTKRFIFIFAAFCSLWARAVARPVPTDSIGNSGYQYSMEKVQSVTTPSYLDGVLVASPWTANWFVGVSGGASAFLGNPLGCEDLFGRLQPSWAVNVGKWFTPHIGSRIGWQGGKFKDGALDTRNFHHYHADLLWSLLGEQRKDGTPAEWSLVPYVGMGLLHHKDNGQKQFSLSYGIQGRYRITGRLAATLELGGCTTFREFDGYGKIGKWGDRFLTLSAGLSVTIGKTGWKRVVDARPYVCRNEWLVRRSEALAGANRRYASRHEKDGRIIRELRKILELEGLLDKYGWAADSLYNYDTGNPGNDYSGLNSLMARLRNRHWNGMDPLASPTDTLRTKGDTDTLHSHDIKGLYDSTAMANAHKQADARLAKYTASGHIGIPIYFFFELGTTKLTEPAQGINLDALARVITGHGLYVTVTGAADSMTGTVEINDRLGMARAEYIAWELVRRGVAPDRIEKADIGGISDYTPLEGNRHTQVRLFIPR